MASITDQLRALQNGWNDPNEVVTVTDAAARQIDELVAALRDMLIPYNSVSDDALQQGAENGDQRCVRALKARAVLAKNEGIP